MNCNFLYKKNTDMKFKFMTVSCGLFYPVSGTWLLRTGETAGEGRHLGVPASFNFNFFAFFTFFPLIRPDV